MQREIKEHLNPLFGISDVSISVSLPRTASNKVMRRVLRDQYHQQQKRQSVLASFAASTGAAAAVPSGRDYAVSHRKMSCE